MHHRFSFFLYHYVVHIDYGNRPEASAEADFVRRYCESLDIEFKCRTIEEVTRGVTSRNEYERISRDIRYTTYREAVAKARSDLNKEEMTVGVMLGHHRGDLRENVLSNAHKGSGPLDLSGMTAVSRNDGVTLFRPLLSLEKSFVFDYAHAFGVPYFKGKENLELLDHSRQSSYNMLTPLVTRPGRYNTTLVNKRKASKQTYSTSSGNLRGRKHQ